MVNRTSLRELDDKHQQETATARKRIDLAEQYTDYYHSRMRMVTESFYELAARQGVADDPEFRSTLHRVSNTADENTRSAFQMIAHLEEDYQTMTVRHAAEREDVVAEQRENS